ncbi:hypothetical protein GE300_04615 [Rhodobacteraceae bacterium 2CG4]|uniref:Uncharacterized protein n=1 Tax=Halovulum marinum TaxID=2662447 RepID=A0A6L5YYI4_9RHOB|nr:hypothetical protein [Halovulum marinum]MSU88905.1 hypothetical protein [Halovulum marinum]
MVGGKHVASVRESLGTFGADEKGASSTEWLVAVAAVVMMAVPVMALIGDSSRKSSNDIVVSIQDADSFGGSGYDGSEATLNARVSPDAEDFVPGSDLGVGFPLEGEEEDTAATETARPMVNPTGLPRFYAGASGTVSRSGGGGIGGGPILAPRSGSAAGVNLTGGGDTRPVQAALPERARHEFAFLRDKCADPTVIASIEARQDYLRDQTDVVASGR